MDGVESGSLYSCTYRVTILTIKMYTVLRWVGNVSAVRAHCAKAARYPLPSLCRRLAHILPGTIWFGKKTCSLEKGKPMPLGWFGVVFGYSLTATTAPAGLLQLHVALTIEIYALW